MEKVLGIPPELVEEVGKDIEREWKLPNDLNPVFAWVFNEQPLYRLLQIRYAMRRRVYGLQHAAAYNLGGSASFRIVSTHLEQSGRIVHLESADLKVHKQSEIESSHDVFTVDTKQAGYQIYRVDGDQFREVLRADSGALVDYINGLASRDEAQFYSPVWNGAVDVLRPYYGKLEARILGEMFPS